MTRRLAALLLFCLASRAGAEVTAPEVEQAAETARRAASTLAGGQPAVFFETLDVDGILSRSAAIGVARWLDLTDAQKNRLRSLLRERFLRELWPTDALERGSIAWMTARPDGKDDVAVWIGLDYPGNRQLKTTWLLSRQRAEWRVTDVHLSDPGVSLARAFLRSLSGEPLRPTDRARAAWEAAMPRLALLAVILLVVVLFWRRARQNRRILIMTALAPFVIVALDGVLAVSAAVAERWTMREGLPTEPWRRPAAATLEAIDAGEFAEARRRVAVAAAAGADAAPLLYALGLSESAGGDTAAAAADFESSLAQRPPAPGSARELAAIALSQGSADVARKRLGEYLTHAGPDPEALTLLAVSAITTGRKEEALEAIEAARHIVGGGLKGAELEARIRARAGDAAGTVATLRPLEGTGLLDRALLRRDPAYLAIATAPEWESFLAEKPKK